VAIWGEVTPCTISTKCGLWGDMLEVITCAIFGDCRLRGVGVVRGVSLPYAIDLRSTLKCTIQHWSHYHVMYLVMLCVYCSDKELCKYTALYIHVFCCHCIIVHFNVVRSFDRKSEINHQFSSFQWCYMQHVCSSCGNHFCWRCCSCKVPRSIFGATGLWQILKADCIVQGLINYCRLL